MPCIQIIKFSYNTLTFSRQCQETAFFIFFFSLCVCWGWMGTQDSAQDLLYTRQARTPPLIFTPRPRNRFPISSIGSKTSFNYINQSIFNVQKIFKCLKLTKFLKTKSRIKQVFITCILQKETTLHKTGKIVSYFLKNNNKKYPSHSCPQQGCSTLQIGLVNVDGHYKQQQKNPIRKEKERDSVQRHGKCLALANFSGMKTSEPD